MQFGLIHRSQALAEGMTERMVDWCLLTGDWFVFLPGVYALRGSTPCWLRDEMGAVLWAGPYAAASGRAAGALWGLIIDGTFIARLDVAWPELKVGIEVDSRRHHMGHAAWERDAARYSKVVSFDWRILTVTSGQLRRNSEEFAAQVLRLVGRRSLDL